MGLVKEEMKTDFSHYGPGVRVWVTGFLSKMEEPNVTDVPPWGWGAFAPKILNLVTTELVLITPRGKVRQSPERACLTP